MNQELQDYINEERKHGTSDEVIKQRLRDNGWQDDMFLDYFFTDTSSQQEPYLQEHTEKTKNHNTLIFIILGVIIVLAGGAYFAYAQGYFNFNKDNTSQEEIIVEEENNDIVEEDNMVVEEEKSLTSKPEEVFAELVIAANKNSLEEFYSLVYRGDEYLNIIKDIENNFPDNVDVYNHLESYRNLDYKITNVDIKNNVAILNIDVSKEGRQKKTNYIIFVKDNDLWKLKIYELPNSGARPPIDDLAYLDYQVCEDQEDQNLKNECYYDGGGIEEEDERYCQKIDNFQDFCFITLAEIKNDMSICDYLWNDNKCLGIVNQGIENYAKNSKNIIRRYIDEEHNYTIDLPSNWLKMDGAGDIISLEQGFLDSYFFSNGLFLIPGKEYEEMIKGVGVYVEKIYGSVNDLDTYIEYYVSNKTEIKDLTLKNGLVAKEIIDESGRGFKYGYLLLKGDYVYSIAFYEDNDLNRAILNSFNFIDNNIPVKEDIITEIKLSEEDTALDEKNAFPEIYNKDIDIDNNISLDNLILPKTLNGNLSFYVYTSLDGLNLPETVNGNLSFFHLTEAKDLILPKTVNGYISFDSLVNAENLILPEIVNGSVAFGMLESAKGIKFPKEITNRLHIPFLKTIEGLELPEKVGWSVDLYNLPESDKQELRNRYPSLSIN